MRKLCAFGGGAPERESLVEPRAPVVVCERTPEIQAHLVFDKHFALENVVAEPARLFVELDGEVVAVD